MADTQDDVVEAASRAFLECAGVGGPKYDSLGDEERSQLQECIRAALSVRQPSEDRLREAYRDGLRKAAAVVRRWVSDENADLIINVDEGKAADRPTLLYVLDTLERYAALTQEAKL